MSPDGKYVAVTVMNGTNKPPDSPFFNANGILQIWTRNGTQLSKAASCRSASGARASRGPATAVRCWCSAWWRRRSRWCATPDLREGHCKRSAPSRPRAGRRASAPRSPDASEQDATSQGRRGGIPLHPPYRALGPLIGRYRRASALTLRAARICCLRPPSSSSATAATFSAASLQPRSCWTPLRRAAAESSHVCSSHAPAIAGSRSIILASWAWSTSPRTVFPTAAAISHPMPPSRTGFSWRQRAPIFWTSAASPPVPAPTGRHRGRMPARAARHRGSWRGEPAFPFPSIRATPR